MRLPDFVTLAEFNLWSSTISDAEGIFACEDLAHACTVLKVGGRLVSSAHLVCIMTPGVSFPPAAPQAQLMI